VGAAEALGGFRQNFPSGVIRIGEDVRVRTDTMIRAEALEWLTALANPTRPTLAGRSKKRVNVRYWW
jgi:hypothetical protein